MEKLMDTLKNGTMAKKFQAKRCIQKKIWLSDDLKTFHIGISNHPQTSFQVQNIIKVVNGDSKTLDFAHPQNCLIVYVKNRTEIIFEFESSIVKSTWKKGITSLISL